MNVWVNYSIFIDNLQEKLLKLLIYMYYITNKKTALLWHQLLCALSCTYLIGKENNTGKVNMHAKHFWWKFQISWGGTLEIGHC